MHDGHLGRAMERRSIYHPQVVHDRSGSSTCVKRQREVDLYDERDDDGYMYHTPRLAPKRVRRGTSNHEGRGLAEFEPFVVLKENGISHRARPGSAVMERTASGHSIRPEPTERSASTELLEDDEAAQRVQDHLASFQRRFPDSKHERILRSIIRPPSRGGAEAAYPLDNDALESLFSAANEIFFNGRLSQRVAWDWSHASSPKYDSRVLGATALRRTKSRRGFETLIVLSSPLLHDPRYSRRLLISTFLHELVHCYLFICCGFRARDRHGHTTGFRRIARLIDDWVGSQGMLHLSKIEADLELFLHEGNRATTPCPPCSFGSVACSQLHHNDVGACSAMDLEQEHGSSLSVPWTTYYTPRYPLPHPDDCWRRNTS